MGVFRVTVLVGAVILLWLGAVWVTHFSSLFGSLEQRGQFGDSFGSVNALFSGLAFAGVVYAILLQRRELQLQREELQLTRKELQRAASAQEKSNEAQMNQLDRQTQEAKLAALTALLNWEMSEQERRGRKPMLSRPDHRDLFADKDGETVAKIRAILNALEY